MNGRAAVVLAACVASAPLAGCDGGLPAATVSGEVTVDGTPVEKGVISFTPADGAGAPATGEIANGRYEVRTVAGSKRVQISVPVVVGKRKESPNGPWVEITAESLPAKYHSGTELAFDVQAGGNTKDWSLAVKKK